MKVTQLSIKDNSVNPVQLANFLKKHIDSYNNHSLQYYLELAKKLIAGENYVHTWRAAVPKNEFLNVSIIEVFDKEEESFIQASKEWQYYDELKEKGANGDAQAAIEFCKAVKAGKYNNMPRA
jgi:hypothetical protein